MEEKVEGFKLFKCLEFLLICFSKKLIVTEKKVNFKRKWLRPAKVEGKLHALTFVKNAVCQ